MTEDLVTAMYGCLPWMFALHGRAGGLGCAYGSERLAPDPLPSLLWSAFSDSALDLDLDDDASGVDADVLASLPHAVALTGVPTMKLSAQIDRLCGVLRGVDGEWAYLVRGAGFGESKLRVAARNTGSSRRRGVKVWK